MGEKVVTSTFGRQHIDFFFFFKLAHQGKGRKCCTLWILTTTLWNQYYHPRIMNEGVEVGGSGRLGLSPGPELPPPVEFCMALFHIEKRHSGWHSSVWEAERSLFHFCVCPGSCLYPSWASCLYLVKMGTVSPNDVVVHINDTRIRQNY